YLIWQRLVAVGCGGFLICDLLLFEEDFDAGSFLGGRCFLFADPGDWEIWFSDLASYRGSWLGTVLLFLAEQFADVFSLQALLIRTHLDEIEIAGDRALARKKFYGDVRLADGSYLADQRQTLFRLHRRNGQWKIVGFFGQLPLVHVSSKQQQS